MFSLSFFKFPLRENILIHVAFNIQSHNYSVFSPLRLFNHLKRQFCQISHIGNDLLQHPNRVWFLCSELKRVPYKIG